MIAAWFCSPAGAKVAIELRAAMRHDLIVLIALASFAGSVIQGSIGFGFAIVALPLMALAVPVQTAAVGTGILGAIMSCGFAWRSRGHIDYRVFWSPLAGSLAGRAVGVYLLLHISATLLTGAVGLVLIAFAASAYVSPHLFKMAPSHTRGALFGLSGGVLGGLCGMPGPPLAIYLSSAMTNKEQFFSTIQGIFAIGGLLNVALFIWSGSVDRGVMLTVGIGLAALGLGAVVGRTIFRAISKEQLLRLVHLFMIVMGGILVVRAVR